MSTVNPGLTRTVSVINLDSQIMLSEQSLKRSSPLGGNKNFAKSTSLDDHLVDCQSRRKEVPSRLVAVSITLSVSCVGACWLSSWFGRPI
ncbi:uncharacterized protein BDV17DRAFT_4116 [Aspergillus undulatus]|uniref:uncharacterized protein n=1 Tax=Aspergillus undulatus TaxID=1810928 RepID=UPI003CCE063D